MKNKHQDKSLSNNKSSKPIKQYHHLKEEEREQEDQKDSIEEEKIPEKEPEVKYIVIREYFRIKEGEENKEQDKKNSIWL